MDPGPNEILNKIIKLYNDILISYLKHLFNACVTQGVYFKLYRKTKTIVLKNRQLYKNENISINCVIEYGRRKKKEIRR